MRRHIRFHPTLLAYAIGSIMISILFAGIKTSSAMMLSPVLYDLSIDAGEVIEKTIQITNDSAIVSTYSFSSENFVAEGERGSQKYLPANTKTDLASWMSWSQDRVTIQPGATVRVPIRISVPSNAIAGGHYATMFATRTDGAGGKDSVGFSEQIGVLFLVRVSGQLTERASVDSFHLRCNDGRLNRLPATFDLRIRNEGSVHIRPTGSIVIRNAIGKTVSILPFNESRGAVLPNSLRYFELRWGSAALSINRDGGFWTEVKNEWKGFAFGRYTAELRAVYGDRAQPLERVRVVFWVIPWHVLIVGFGCLILLIALAKLYKHCLICRLISKSDAKNKTRRSRSS